MYWITSGLPNPNDYLQSIQQPIFNQTCKYKTLQRLPIILFIKPRREDDRREFLNVCNVNLCVSSPNKAKYRNYFTDQSNFMDVSITDSENEVTFHLRQKNSEGLNSTSHGCCLRFWLPAQPEGHVFLTADDEQSLINACDFDGLVYLVYGDQDSVVLRRCRLWLMANGQVRLSNQNSDRKGSVLFPSMSGMPAGSGLKLLQQANFELNQLKIETLEDARKRREKLTNRM